MDDAPPPTEHILRPHHLVLLSILMITFKDLEIKKFPPDFAIHLLRILLNEAAELLKAIGSGPHTEVKDVAQFLAAINTVHSDIHSAEKLGNFLGNLPALFVEKVLEEKPRLMRRSIFGYFCRRCFVSYVKLSFGGLNKLREEYIAWCSNKEVIYEPIIKDNLTMDHLLHKTQSDKKAWAKPDSYAAWEKAKATGDETLAMENIRRFFEQHFHDQSDSLLLHEAIGVARTANDRQTLQHCLSLLRRLPPPPGEKPFLNEIQPDMHPLEILYDVKKLMHEDNVKYS
ncbi:hypothetical protein MD484_g4376, partial [Candolleomyces efflorescens]